jgi:hypothetical protein
MAEDMSSLSDEPWNFRKNHRDGGQEGPPVLEEL